MVVLKFRKPIVFCCILFLIFIFTGLPVHAETRQRVFDNNNLLNEEQIAALEETCEQLTEELGVQFVILTKPDNEAQTDIKDYGNDFYRDQFSNGEIEDGISLTLDTYNRQYWILAFGELRSIITEDEMGSVIVEMRPYMSEDDYSGASECFLEQISPLIQSRAAELQYRRLLKNMVVPTLEPGGFVYDLAGMLSEDEIFSLEKNAQNYMDNANCRFIIVTADLADPELVYDFKHELWKENNFLSNCEALLVIDSNTYSLISDINGSLWEKIRYQEQRDIESATNTYILEHGVLAGCEYFEQEMSQYQKRIIPVYVVDEAGNCLLRSVMLGFGVSILLVGGRLLFRKRLGKKVPPTRSYVVPQSFVLSKKEDRFVSTVTSQTERPKDTDSSSDSFGSSDSSGSSDYSTGGGSDSTGAGGSY